MFLVILVTKVSRKPLCFIVVISLTVTYCIPFTTAFKTNSVFPACYKLPRDSKLFLDFLEEDTTKHKFLMYDITNKSNEGRPRLIHLQNNRHQSKIQQ